MFGAPSNVPVVGCEALIAPVSYVQWLLGPVGGLSIPHGARGVKGQRPHLTRPRFPPIPERPSGSPREGIGFTTLVGRPLITGKYLKIKLCNLRKFDTLS